MLQNQESGPFVYSVVGSKLFSVVLDTFNGFLGWCSQIQSDFSGDYFVIRTDTELRTEFTSDAYTVSPLLIFSTRICSNGTDLFNNSW